MKFLGYLLVICFLCSCHNRPEKKYTYPVNGVLDLSDWNFEQDGLVTLAGTWKYAWMQDSADYLKSDYDVSDWDSITVPTTFKKARNEIYGFAWLRLTVITKEDYPLRLFLFNTIGASELYCNGNKILSFGIAGNNKENYRPERTTKNILLPANDTLNFAWKVVNFDDRYGGPRKSVVIGKANDIDKLASKTNFESTLIFGIILIFFIYHIIIWYSRRKDLCNLYFGLFCLIILIRLFDTGIIHLFSLSVHIPFYLIHKTEILTLPCAAALSLLFISKMFPEQASVKVNQFLYGILVILALIPIFTSSRFYTSILFIHQISLMLVSVVIIIIVIKAIINRTKHAKIMFAGILVLFICAIYDISVAHVPGNTHFKISLGFVFFILIQSSVLSFKFADAFKIAEHLSKNLKDEVNAKTHDIQLKSEELRKINFELKEANEYKSRFFQNITHEFKTPLTLMKGSIDMILDGYFGEVNQQLKKQLQVAKKNSVNLNDYINQILEFTKIDAKHIKVNIKKFDLVKFLKSVHAAFAPLAQSKSISLNFEPEIKELSVCFDSAKLEIILNNLLSNAIKYSKENSNICIIVKESIDDFTIAVSDTGIGILKNELPYIFERFRQLDSGLTRKDKGAGIGLALVKEYVDLLQGSISVDSKPGKGSVFTINFSKDLHKLDFEYKTRTEEERNYEKGIVDYDFSLIEKQESNLSDGKNKIATILIVEDNEDMLSFIRQILTDKYTILEACDGKEGYKVCKSELPDIVISDVMMPNMDGFGLCKAIVENETTSHIPVILLSANADEKFQHKGLQEGAISYITKPFNPGKLRLQIKNQLNYILKRQIENWNFITKSKEEITSISTGDTFLKKVQAIVLDNMHKESFDVDAFSKTIGLSRTQLYRKMKGVTGKSPGDFIRSIRLLEAKAMIENSNATNLTVAEIAYKVGFSDPNYFSRAFKKQFGVRPSKI